VTASCPREKKSHRDLLRAALSAATLMASSAADVSTEKMWMFL